MVPQIQNRTESLADELSWMDGTTKFGARQRTAMVTILVQNLAVYGISFM